MIQVKHKCQANRRAPSRRYSRTNIPFRLLFILSAFFCQLLSFANPIDQTKAQYKAALFLTHHASLDPSIAHGSVLTSDLRLAYRADIRNGESAYYIFNYSAGGFVIVSGDDEVETILGFSHEGSFDAEGMPIALRTILEKYKSLMSTPSGKRKLISNHHDALRIANATTYADIEPMTETKWNQRAPYNNLCPYDATSGRRCVTGCVAVAFAQLMYYHRWPLHGTGSHSYEYKGQTYSADFSASEYQWDKMKTCYEQDPNDDPDNIVAQLLYDCAIMADSGFEPYGTCGWYDTERLSKYFSYNDDICWVDKKSLTNAAFIATVYGDLSKGLPILICGSDEYDDSHCWLVDGYKKGNYFSCNWGWGGSADGYYLLSELLYPSDIDIMYNIYPKENTWYVVSNDKRYVEMNKVGQIVKGSDDSSFNILGLDGSVLMSGVEEAFFTDNLNAILGKKGDVNGDGSVNVVDVMLVVECILHKPPLGFIFDNADMNKDGLVNITDAIAIVDLILYNKTDMPPMVRFMDTESLLLQKTELGLVMSMENTLGITACQLNVTLPEGCSLQEVHTLGAASKTHSVRMEKMEGNEWKIVIFSQGGSILPSDSAFLRLDFDNVCEQVSLNDIICANTAFETVIIPDVEEILLGLPLISTEFTDTDAYSINGRRMGESEKGVFISNGKKGVKK